MDYKTVTYAKTSRKMVNPRDLAVERTKKKKKKRRRKKERLVHRRRDDFMGQQGTTWSRTANGKISKAGESGREGGGGGVVLLAVEGQSLV